MEGQNSLEARVAYLESKLGPLTQALSTSRLFDPSLEGSVVEINVGGTIFTTFASTLTKYPASMLAAMFSGRHPVARDKAGRPFLDRNPKMFALILEYLRTGIYPRKLLQEVEIPFFECEIDYFGVGRPARVARLEKLVCRQSLKVDTDERMLCMCFDVWGDAVAIGCRDGSVHLWSLTEGNKTGQLVGHAAQVTDVRIIHMVSSGHGSVATVATSASSSSTTSTSSSSTMTTSPYVNNPLANSGGNNNAVLMMANANVVTNVNNNNANTNINAANTANVAANTNANVNPLLINPALVNATTTSARRNRAVVAVVTVSADGTMRIWDMWTQQPLRTIDVAVGTASSGVNCLDLIPPEGSSSTSSSSSYSSSSSSSSHFPTSPPLSKMSMSPPLRSSESVVETILASPHGPLVVTAGRTVNIYSLSTGQCLRSWRPHHAENQHSSFSFVRADNKHVFAAIGNRIEVFSMGNLSALNNVFNSNSATQNDFLYDLVGSSSVKHMVVTSNQVLASYADCTMGLWSRETGQIVRTLVGYQSIVSRFIVVGSLLFAGCYDGSLMVWNTQTGQCVRKVEHAHRAVVRGIKWMDDSLYTVGADAKVRVWQMVQQEGQEDDVIATTSTLVSNPTSTTTLATSPTLTNL